MRALSLVLFASGVAALAVGGAGAGSYVPPPGEGDPHWLSDGSIVLSSSTGVRTVGADGSGERVVYPEAVWIPYEAHVAPTGPLFAFVADDQAAQLWLAVENADGTQTRLLVRDAVPVGWLPDGSRLIFYEASAQNGQETTRFFSIRPDGTDLTAYPANVRGTPSPGGTQFAYVTGSPKPRLHVVAADGSSDTIVAGTSPAEPDARPAWSPDGTRIAFWAGGGSLAVARVAGGSRAYPVPGARPSGGIAWAPDGSTIFADGVPRPVRIDLSTGEEWRLAGIPGLYSGLEVSPDGSRIAYAASGECRDRVGIYVANVDGSDRRRISNGCRIDGTDGPDILHGGFSQVVLGLGGDDTLYADDTGYSFEGDTLYGGPGKDTLVGGSARDTLSGGPGDDTLSGGPSADILIGGPGRDRISGGGGKDTIGARDGERDRISCGRGSDIVYADRVDVVGADCEAVHRR
jgi:Tol biopolymer transport system component